jgi:hypothetical protein
VETGTYCDTELDVAPDDEFVTADRFAAVVAKMPAADIAEAILRVPLSRGS